MKKFATLLSMILTLPVYAETINIICPSNAAVLSTEFSRNWQKNPFRDNYYSYVTHSYPNYMFIGTLHTIGSLYPRNPNPDLTYYSLNLTNIDHYGVWSIDCNYSIHNSDMVDASDGYLHFVADVSNTLECKKISEQSVSCKSK